MTHKIIFTRSDGGVSVVTPTHEFLKKFNTLTEGMAEVHYKSIPSDATDVKIIKASDVPTDRTFRNAWRQSDGLITVDMPLAREMQRDKIRTAREPLLEGLDVEYIRADESGCTLEKAAIVVKKQKLRDLTARPEIEVAKTPEELKAFWPDELTK